MKKPANPEVTRDMTAYLYKCFGKSDRHYFRWKDQGQWFQSAVFFDTKRLAVESIYRLGFGRYMYDDFEVQVFVDEPPKSCATVL